MHAGRGDVTPAGPEHLDLLIPARARPRHLGVGYARLVRVLRFGLVLMMLGVVAVIFLWPELQRTARPAPAPANPEVARNVLLKPRFEAVDTDTQPYTITADEARQDAKDPDLINLTKPIADITLKDGSWLALEANTGLFRQNAQQIELTGDVRLFQDQGYEMRTDHAKIDLKTQQVEVKQDVAGQGPLGQLSAARMHGDGRAGVLVFYGPATLVLHEQVFE